MAGLDFLTPGNGWLWHCWDSNFTISLWIGATWELVLGIFQLVTPSSKTAFLFRFLFLSIFDLDVYASLFTPGGSALLLDRLDNFPSR